VSPLHQERNGRRTRQTMIAPFVKKPLDLYLVELHLRRRDAAAAESSPILDVGRQIEAHPPDADGCGRCLVRLEVELPPLSSPPCPAEGRAPSTGAASAHGWRSSPLRQRASVHGWRSSSLRVMFCQTVVDMF
jgi:hypothetical protein